MAKCTNGARTAPRRRPGTKALYRPKAGSAVTMKMTGEGIALMDTLSEDRGLSRGDFCEYLVRHHGDAVPKGLLDQVRDA